MKYAQGGYISGPSKGDGPRFVIEHLGHTAEGFPVVSINGGKPELVITRDLLDNLRQQKPETD